MEHDPDDDGSVGAGRDRLRTFIRIKGVATLVIAVPAAALSWLALDRLDHAAREFEVSSLAAGPATALLHPWIVCIPALGMIFCAFGMILGGRGLALASATLAVLLLLGMIAIVGLTMYGVLAPMYEYQPL